MTPYQNERPVLLNGQHLRWMPLVGCFPLIITLCASVGIIAGGITLQEMTVPMLGMLMISGMGFGAGAVAVAVDAALETRNIRRVLNNPLAVWPQYANPDQWAKAVAKYEEEIKESTRPDPGGAIVVTIVIAVIGGFMIFNGFGLYVTALVGFLLIVYGIVFGGPIVRRWQGMNHLNRLRGSAIPRTVIARTGVYDPFRGYQSLKGLQRVSFVPPDEVKDMRKNLRKDMMAGDVIADLGDEYDRRLADQGWGQAVFTVKRRTNLSDGVSTTTIHVITVRVPPDQFGDVQSILGQFA